MTLPHAVNGLRPDEIADVEELSVATCWSLLRSETVGRLAVRTATGVDIFPINYLVSDATIFLRSAPGSKLVDIANEPEVAFEADGKRRRTRWSVVAKGTAQRMAYDADIHDSGVLELRTLTSSAKWNYVRIIPATITGRRFTAPLD
jgi:nitroimidazol reductase NimA-like FMN-containing flavoprotein (pyridoxamine 5'-phosphate oxidase superfamily)